MIARILRQAPATAGACRKMRAIMADPNARLYRRLDAAEVVLSYECGVGAGVGVDPETIAAASFKFLRAAADDVSTPEALKFRALKSIVAVENARAQAKSSAITNASPQTGKARSAATLGAAEQQCRRGL
jgi:hypothetical protein